MTAALKTHVTEHSVRVGAPPTAIFALIADVTQWPQMFSPTVHVEVLEAAAPEQLLRIWALAHGQVRDWVSRRSLSPREHSIAFQQVVSAAPVAAMGGEWLIQPATPHSSTVVLRHTFQAVGNDPDAVRLIEEATDRNSRSELAALAHAAEQGELRNELRFTFCDTERIDGQAEEVFGFLHRADRWPDRLPHVARVDLAENDPGGGPVQQRFEMVTRSPDGSAHTTTSIRLSFADRGTIVYKQLQVPAGLMAHTGRWVVEPDGAGHTTATSWHTVVLDPEAVPKVLGPQATITDARHAVRQALGRNSATTLRCARTHAEASAA